MKKVVIVGAGRTGCLTARALARRGVKLTVIDRDAVAETDLLQTGYAEGDVGCAKATVLAQRVGAKAVVTELNEENAAKLLRNANVVADCTDNWQTRAIISRACRTLGVPWVYCAALRNVSACATHLPSGPRFECWAPRPPPQSCSVEGVTREALRRASQKQVKEILTLLTKQPAALAGKLWVFDGMERIVLLPQGDCKRVRHYERAFRLCGSNEWQFYNKFKPTRRIAARLGARFADGVVAGKIGNMQFVAMPDGRILVRAATAKRARQVNACVLAAGSAAE
ncbi:hypothetical protein AUJ14_01920 [Candidatus Micrarchaeota archaeon CG1_02_55_22]|nr:MAG: hypothetical protein AUJ14_01920 [Candidatus Micrarchaeota archaeon CG1_02_55_22]